MKHFIFGRIESKILSAFCFSNLADAFKLLIFLLSTKVIINIDATITTGPIEVVKIPASKELPTFSAP